jgi:solute carrier family 35 protein F5
MPEIPNQPRRRYLAGVLALLAVVFIWVASSFVMNVSVEIT